MQKISSDQRITGYSPSAKMRLIYVDVTDSAKTLERNHLCGPVVGLIQGEAMAVTAIIAGELSHQDETVSLRVSFPEGRVQGLIMECSHQGALRGYTRVKVINELDDSDYSNEKIEELALGRVAKCTVVRSTKDASSHASFDVTQEDCAVLSDVLEGYYDNAVQRQTLSQLAVTSEDNHLTSAQGIMIDLLPDADESHLDVINAVFNDGILQQLFDARATLSEFALALGLDDLVIGESSPLRFECTCSSERIFAMIHNLPVADLDALIAEDKATSIFCHMCGKNYLVPLSYIQSTRDCKNDKSE